MSSRRGLCAAASLLSVAALYGQFGNRLSAPIDVERLNGPPLQISNYAEHSGTVILFLSTRSDKTAAAAGTIQRLNAMNRRNRVMFVAVFPNPAESAEEVRAFCQDSGFIFPCYRDPQHKAATQLGATVTPQAFVIDKDARLRYRGPIGKEDDAVGLAGALKSLAEIRPGPTYLEPGDGTPISMPGPAPLLKDSYESIHFASELIFEKIPGAPAHHASSIAEAPNGDLLVTWYGGSYESSDDEALYMARRKKGERNWSTPELLFRDAAHPVGNAIIFVDPAQKIWILWGRMEATQPLLAHTGWDGARLMYRVSNDNGHAWTKDVLFPMETSGWLPRNLPVTLPGGELLVPLSDERDNVDKSFFVKTKDNGKTWVRSQNIPNQNVMGEQPAVAPRPDGSLLAFVRLKPALLQTESTDGGLNWTPAHATDLKCPDSAISLRALRNGHLLLAHNDSDRARTPLSITRSLDGGKTWSSHLVFESNPGEYSYPSILQTSDGLIHVTYTYRRYSIKHVEFDENWLDHLNRPN
ncbi:MAG TPA: exo-alpha-sialidase [Candidatus Acidoferrales bacterium]|nr:exo-alpha-sialidase [Candidatus Acidoferrales bacterium]